MATGRNHVTADMRISAEAQLKNSNEFSKKLENIVKNFNPGEKFINSLKTAQKQLKDYEKTLEKISKKSVISGDEAKEFVKAGKEISNLINKTEKLYSGFTPEQWRKYSREYIAQVEKAEKEAAKIKEKYNKETGGRNFDKDYASLDKYSNKIKEISKQLEILDSSKDNKIKERIDAENKALQEQFELLQKVKMVENERKSQRQNLINNYNQNAKAKINSSSSKFKTDEDSVRREIANNEYQKLVSTFSEVSKKREEILDSGNSEKQIQKDLIALAKQYGLQHVKTTQQFEKQYKSLQEQKNFYNLLKNRDQLAQQKDVTEEVRKRLELEKEIADLDTEILGNNGFSNDRDLRNKKKKAENSLDSTKVNVTNSGANLTSAGEDDIANEIVAATNKQAQDLNNELKSTRIVVEKISEFAGKLATQSERAADEQDIKEGTKQQIEATNNDGKETRKTFNDKFNELTPKDKENIKNIGEDKVTRFTKMAPMMTNASQLTDPLSETKKTAEEVERKLFENNQLREKLINVPKKQQREVAKELLKSTDELAEIADKLLVDTLADREKGIELAKKELKKYETTNKAGEHPKRRVRDMARIAELKKFINERDVDDNLIMGAHSTAKAQIAQVKNYVKNPEQDSNVKNSNLPKAAKETSEAIEKAVEQTQFLGSAFDDIKNKIGYFLSLNYVFDQMTRKINEAVQTTKEMDKDMTQIGLVLGKTSGQVWKSFGTYSQMAERLNTTTSEVTQSMKLFYQQGLNTTEVNKMVEASAIAAALGESSMAEASETLTSIINSYNLSANEAMMVTDKISQIAIVSAADFGELSTAIEKVASSAASAGLDLDHMMGYLAKMIETTREAPTNIGTALKTIVANFTQFKEDPSGLSEEGSEINKVDTALKSVGISLTNTSGDVRDLSEVLDELGGIWNKLNRNQKSYLATQIAGTRQQSRFYALMNDYERTLELVAEGSNSAGKAQQQFALYSNSLEASASRLTNEWEKFFNSITQGNGVVSHFNNTLTLLMKAVNAVGPIGTVLGLGSLIKSLRESITLFGNLSQVIENRRKNTDNFKDDVFKINLDKDKTGKQKEDEIKNRTATFAREQTKEIKNLSKEQLNYVSVLEKNNKIQEILNKKIEKAPNAFVKLKLNISKTGLSIQNFVASAKVGLAQLKAAITSLATKFALLTALSLALKVASAAMSGIKSGLGLNTEEYIENSEKAKENSTNIKGLTSEYETLAKKVNKTKEEQERLKEITKEVTEVDKALGQQLKNNVNNYEANVTAMKKYSKQQEKIAAQNSTMAMNSESKKSHIWGLQLFDEDLWTGIFGSSNDKQLAKDKQYNNIRTLASNRATESDLNDTQSSMLMNHVENLISGLEEAGTSGYKIKYNFEQAIEEINRYTIVLSKLSDKEQERYNNYLKELSNGNKSYKDLNEEIEKLKLPQEAKDDLRNQLQSRKDSLTSQINNNEYIRDSQKGMANAIALNLPFKDIERLISGAESDLFSKEEKSQYKRDLATLLTDPELFAKYSIALQKGGSAVSDFGKELKNTGRVSELLTNNLEETAKAFSKEEISKIFENYGKIGDLSIKSVMKGEASQLDILKLFADGTIDFKDLNFANGNITVKNAALVSLERAQLDKIFEAVYKQFDTMSEEQKQKALQPLRNTTEQLREDTADKKYVKLIQDKLKPYEEEGAAVEANINAHNNKPGTVSIPLQYREYTDKNGQIVKTPGYKYNYLIDKAYANNYTGGYQANTQFVANPRDPSQAGFPISYRNINGQQIPIADTKNMTVDALKQKNDQIDKLLEQNPQMKLTEQQQAYRTAYSQKKDINTGIKDISGLNSQQKYDYIVQQNNALEESKEKIKGMNKNSQEYYDETYKIYNINKNLTEILKNDEKLYTDITNKNKDLANVIEKNNKEIEKQDKNTQKISDNMDKEIKAQRKNLEIYEKYTRQQNNKQSANLAVFDTYQSYEGIISGLESVKTAYSQLGSEAENVQDVINTVMQDPTLIDCLEIENGAIQWNKEALEERGRAAIRAAKAKADAEIAELNIRIAGLQAESDNIDEWSEEAINNIAEVIGGDSALTDTQQNNTEAEGTNLSISQQNWINWSDTTVKAIEAAGKAYNKFLKAQATKEEQDFNEGGFSANKNIETGGTEGSKDAIKADKIKNIKDTLKADGRSQDKAGVIANLQKQIERIKQFKKLLDVQEKNVGKSVLGGGKNGGGSKDSFKEMEEKLDHFYNYLRKIEKLQSKIDKLREKRNLIDANSNYYIDDLKEENQLLEEQRKLYTAFVADEEDYLAGLRTQLKNSAYGNKVSFDNEGLIQLSQTEFTAKSEKEQERLEAFLELVNLYQEEYNEKLENEKTLIQVQVQHLENIKSMYEKILKRVEDVSTEIERQIGLIEHTATMDFSEINQFGYFGEQAQLAVDGIKYTELEMAKLGIEVDALNNQVKKSRFSELFTWDEELGQWNANDKLLLDPATQKKYEKMGYTWTNIESYVRDTVAESQALNTNIKETTEKANSFRETLKQMLENEISGIQNFFSRSTEMIDKYFNQIDRAMNKIDNEGDMFGTDAGQLETKYKTLVQASVLIKQLVGELKTQQQEITNELTKSFSEYVTFVDGVAKVNEQAVDNSTVLTDQQKAEIKRLVAAYEASEEQIENLEDRLTGYFQQMVEMEQAKRDAIIELKQQVHDELMARDQEEIDNLRSKYDKMSQLDQEYYSELQQRVNDARDLRSQRQESNNISQMQARLSVLKADNGGTYNAEMIELQKQLNDALQTQADNDVNRELERIAREQQQREEDRALTISAMENVLTFKDENNWYWQEAQRIWNEGPESVTGFLRSSREYMNISDEQRAQSFENLDTSMNTAFATLQTAAGITAAISDGIVQNGFDSVNTNIDYIKGQLGNGENGVIYSSIVNTKGAVDSASGAISGAINATPESFRVKMQSLYSSDIKSDIQSGTKAISDYLGADSVLLKKTDSIIDQIKNTATDTINPALSSGFSTLHDALIGKGNSVYSALDAVRAAITNYLGQNSVIYRYLNPRVAAEEAERKAKEAEAQRKAEEARKKAEAEAAKKKQEEEQKKQQTSNAGSGGGTSKPDLKIGSRVSVKPGTKWYYDSYGTNPSGTARGGKITYMNLKGSHQYNIEGLGWIRKQDIVGYSKGGYVDYTGVANVHGTQTEPEAFLNAKQTRLFEGLRDSLVRSASNKTYSKDNQETTKEEYNIDNISIEVKQIADVDSVDKVVRRVKEEIYKDATSNKNNMAVRRR